ncbi:unnamed protein product [Sphenostylis stenocarpa]|uniref:Uncharacterized protein n=1 Tax=Sphenostylis stenocarpa TaxID=92480 RepID=A0AA86VB21_9FABA|nr:unnamed protein product [Sphenostylis stenocarpa]
MPTATTDPNHPKKSEKYSKIDYFTEVHDLCIEDKKKKDNPVDKGEILGKKIIH